MSGSYGGTGEWKVPVSISSPAFFTQGFPDPIASHEDFEQIADRLRIYPEEYEIVDRYWVHQPYAYAVILEHTGSDRDVYRYVLVKPQLSSDAHRLKNSIMGVIESRIKFGEIELIGTIEERRITLRKAILAILESNNLLDESDFEASINSDPGKYKLDLLDNIEQLPMDDGEIIATTDSTVGTSGSGDWLLNKNEAQALIYLASQDILSSTGVSCILNDRYVHAVDTHPETVIDSNLVSIAHVEYDNISVNLSLL